MLGIDATRDVPGANIFFMGDLTAPSMKKSPLAHNIRAKLKASEHPLSKEFCKMDVDYLKFKVWSLQKKHCQMLTATNKTKSIWQKNGKCGSTRPLH